MDYNPLGSSVHGISQERYWSGLLFPPQPRDRIHTSALEGGFFAAEAPGMPEQQ